MYIHDFFFEHSALALVINDCEQVITLKRGLFLIGNQKLNENSWDNVCNFAFTTREEFTSLLLLSLGYQLEMKYCGCATVPSQNNRTSFILLPLFNTIS